jgi:hypothetical protein
MAGLIFKPLSNDLYAIPKAQIMFQPAGTDRLELLGDTDEVTLETTVEETERYTNEAGVRILAKTIVTQVDALLNMTLVQLSDRNRALSLLGEPVNTTQAAAVATVKTFADVEHTDKIYALDALDVDNVVVTDGAGSVTYTIEVDYKLDAKAGFVQLINKPVGADDDLEVTFDSAAILATDGLAKIGIANKTENRGKLIIRGTNEVGPKVMLVLHDVQLRPSGGRAYISETDLDTVEVEGRVFRDENQPAGYELGYEQEIPA